MKVVLLTTETTHHTYYAWKLHERFPLQALFLESKTPKPPFETFHQFEELRDAHEKETLLNHFGSTISDLTRTVVEDSVNDAASLAVLRELAPDVVIVFGTGKLKFPVICSAPVCLNLHGGNPEFYRGVDTLLWAVYHDDFDNLVTTLHFVDEGLDSGDIVFQSRIPIAKDCRLHELRALNTEVCLQLSLLALECVDKGRLLPGRKQVQRGRYYSFMPAALKDVCVKKFERYTASL